MFDAGYLIESYKQAQQAFRGGPLRDVLPVANGDEAPDGYRLIREALQLVGSSPEMEFAASLMTKDPLSAEHRRRAMAGAKPDSLLAKNLSK